MSILPSRSFFFYIFIFLTSLWPQPAHCVSINPATGEVITGVTKEVRKAGKNYGTHCREKIEESNHHVEELVKTDVDQASLQAARSEGTPRHEQDLEYLDKAIQRKDDVVAASIKENTELKEGSSSDNSSSPNSLNDNSSSPTSPNSPNDNSSSPNSLYDNSSRTNENSWSRDDFVNCGIG